MSSRLSIDRYMTFAATLIIAMGSISLFQIIIDAKSVDGPGNGLSGQTEKFSPSPIASLNGEFDIPDISYLQVIGNDSFGANGKLGSYLGLLDVNGDVYDDLVVSAPEAPGAAGAALGGICYIWYGSDDVPAGTLDLRTEAPDVMIRASSPDSKLLESVSSGDLNDDGRKDLVLGIPSQLDSGKVYVLWGRDGGWPQTIDLYKAAGNVPNGNPFGFMRNTDFAIISGYVSTNTLGTRLGQTVMVNDLDLDGIDDLVFTFHGWNCVAIVWGSTDKMQFGSEFTTIRDDLETSKFGERIDIGFIDDDLSPDMAIGAPTRDDESRVLTQVGSVFVVFDVGRVRGNSTLWGEDICRPLIFGEDPYDALGSRVQIDDVNNDALDDILIGVPGDDGEEEDNKDAGQIMVFWGGDISLFPQRMIGMDWADKIIYGAAGETKTSGPDRVGYMFKVADIDADSEAELVISSSSAEKGTINNAGRISGYEKRDVFSNPGIAVDLANIKERFVLWGEDPSDSLGIILSSGDINDDGADDLLSSYPGGDGPDNSRPGCGQVFLLLGSSLHIDDLRIYGPAVDFPKIYTGNGGVVLNFTFLDPEGPGQVEEGIMLLDPSGADIIVQMNRTGTVIETDPYDLIEIDTVGSGFSYSDVRGFFTVSLSLNWYYFMGDEPSITLKLRSVGGQWIFRSFIDPFVVIRDVELSRTISISKNGAPLPTGFEWVQPGDRLNFSLASVVYSDGSERVLTGGWTSLTLFRGAVEVSTETFVPGEWYATDEVPHNGTDGYSLSISRSQPSVPQGLSSIYYPKIGGDMEIPLKTDSSAPSSPQNIIFEPDDGRISIYDDDQEWKVAWEDPLSNSIFEPGSGTRDFFVSVEDGPWFQSRALGGLNATYFRDSNFSIPALQRTDASVDFPESEWGNWGPDPNHLPVQGFSARWNGWIRFPQERYYTFSLAGLGEAILLMDGQVLLDWTDISTQPVSSVKFRNEGDTAPLELYFIQRGGSSAITLLMDDERGAFGPIQSNLLYHPSNSTSFSIQGQAPFQVKVRTRDWAGYLSMETVAGAVVDREPPRFNLSEVRPWYGEPDPAVHISVIDPMISNDPGSGIDVLSLQYRIKSREQQDFLPWNATGAEVLSDEPGADGPREAKVKFKINLGVNWRGSVQFLAKDMVGNEVKSSILSIGVDMLGPTFEVVSPNLLLVQKSTGFNLVVRAIDRPGAGISGESLSWRFKPQQDQDWSSFFPLNGSGIGEEIIGNANIALPVGRYLLQFGAMDSVGNEAVSQEFEVRTEEPRTDLPPVPRISLPANGTKFLQGYLVTFDASGTQDDGLGRFGGVLVYTWFSNLTGYLGSGQVLTINMNTIGHHRIRLWVDDGTPGHNVSTSIDIQITKQGGVFPDDDDDSDGDGDNRALLIIILGIAVVAISLTVMILLGMSRYRKRREEEIRLEYVAKTPDDEDYDRKAELDEHEMGIRMEGGHLTDEEIESQRRSLYGDDSE